MRVTSCCGCCSVKSGVVIIGIYTIVSGIVFPVITIVLERSNEFSVFLKPIIYSVSGIMVIFGAQKRKSKLIFPLLSITFTNLVMGIPKTLIDQIQGAVEYDDPAWVYFVIILCSCGDYVLSFHSFIVIDTFYKDLLEEQYAVPKIGNQVTESSSTSSYILVSPAVTKQNTPTYENDVEK